MDAPGADVGAALAQAIAAARSPRPALTATALALAEAAPGRQLVAASARLVLEAAGATALPLLLWQHTDPSRTEVMDLVRGPQGAALVVLLVNTVCYFNYAHVTAGEEAGLWEVRCFQRGRSCGGTMVRGRLVAVSRPSRVWI